MNINGKNIIITGAANGLGRALIERLAPIASNTVAIDMDRKGLIDLKKIYGKKIRIIYKDLARSQDLRVLINILNKNKSKYDLLINCAGIGSHKRLSNYHQDEIQTLISLNCVAPFVITTSLLSASSFSKDAIIVNIGSFSGEVPLPSLSLYSASKAFLHSFTRSSQLEAEMMKVKLLLVILGSLSDTKFGDNLAVNEGHKFGIYSQFRQSASKAAEMICRSIEKEDRQLVFPAFLRHLIRFERYFPKFTFFLKSFIFHKYYD